MLGGRGYSSVVQWWSFCLVGLKPWVPSPPLQKTKQNKKHTGMLFNYQKRPNNYVQRQSEETNSTGISQRLEFIQNLHILYFTLEASLRSFYFLFILYMSRQAQIKAKIPSKSRSSSTALLGLDPKPPRSGSSERTQIKIAGFRVATIAHIHKLYVPGALPSVLHTFSHFSL